MDFYGDNIMVFHGHQRISPSIVDDAVTDVFILASHVHREPSDNSCLYHSLCSGLQRCSLNVKMTSTSLRSDINFFISSHGSSVISLGPSVRSTISDAITQCADCSLDRYIINQSNQRSWGGIIEIATCVVMYPVNIYVFRPIPGS